VRVTVILMAVLVLAGPGCGRVAKLVAMGDVVDLRHDVTDRPASGNPRILILALDGAPRRALYEMLRRGELPGLGSLLGRTGDGRFPHAYFHSDMYSVLPSVTTTAWATIFTGMPPSRHGVAGNEFFIRERRRFVAPIPVSFFDPEPIIAVYTDGYANRLLEAPTIYERLRERHPGIRISISVSQFYEGADRLIVAQRSAAIDMVPALLGSLSRGRSFDVYRERDREILETIVEELEDEDEPVPDVLTLYVAGVDLHAHAVPGGADEALRRVLVGDVDGMFGEIGRALEKRGALRDRWVVLVTDHGHQTVPSDERHAIGTREDRPPVVTLRSAGFRVRPYELEVDDEDFQAVFAYQGPIAFLYVADRSTCPRPGDRCDWTRPPRYEEDVLAAAEAIRSSTELDGALDMILTRRPRPFAEVDLPFRVYAGKERLEPVTSHLEKYPRPGWTSFEDRLRDLAVGRYGERAGDVMLIARGGYYFNKVPYHSIHGGPTRREGEVAFIVAHPGRDSPSIAALVTGTTGRATRQDDVARVLMRLSR
jgi:hypothetical protein